MCIIQLFSHCFSAGIAVDGPNKNTSELNGTSICLIKKKGKVKALDEELYSEWHVLLFCISIKTRYYYDHPSLKQILVMGIWKSLLYLILN